MSTVTIWLDPAIEGHIRKLSAASGQSVSAVVKEALKALYGAGEMPQGPRLRGGRRMKSREKGFRPWAEEMLSKAEEMACDAIDEEFEPVGPEVKQAVANSLAALDRLEIKIKSMMQNAGEAARLEGGRLLGHLREMKAALGSVLSDTPESTAMRKVQAAAAIAEGVAQKLREGR